jgi:hypothetical protein
MKYLSLIKEKSTLIENLLEARGWQLAASTKNLMLLLTDAMIKICKSRKTD